MSKMKITLEEAKKQLDKGMNKAKELLKDPAEVEKFLQKVEKKLNDIPMVGKTFAIIPAMISLVRSYISKEYTEVPLGTILGVLSALLYVISPIDLIPDVAGPLGYMDDATVILMCLKGGAESDIRDYQKWRKENNKIV